MSAQKYGILHDVVDDHTLDEWKNIYQKVSTTYATILEKNYGICWGIDKKCYAYNWFLKKVMPVIAKTFDANTKLIFSSFIDLYTPLPQHIDIKPLPEGASGKHYVSILVPYSIDNEKRKLCKGASTRFYDENKTLIDTIQWKSNCLLWFDSNYLHDSGDFTNHGIESKQFFVTHTYV